MLSRLRVPLALCLVTALAFAAVPSSSARIDALPSIDSQFRAGAKKLGRSIARVKRQVRRVRFSMLPPGGRAVAISNERLAGFPRHGRTYMIMSTGDARRADNKNTSGSFGRGQGGPFVRGARDVTILRFGLRVPRSRNCLSFSFRFLTEEYPEFVGDEFNDFFIAELGDSTWNAHSNMDPTITAPGNFAFGEDSNLITVNGAGAVSVGADNADGTTYDGATDVLRASTPVKRGRRTLYLSIGDQGDRDYDSAVFVDNLRLTNDDNCSTGVVVDE